jgi:hypothetical protein
MDELIALSEKARDVADYVDDNSESLSRELSPHDWMHIYATSVKEYGM